MVAITLVWILVPSKVAFGIVGHCCCGFEVTGFGGGVRFGHSPMKVLSPFCEVLSKGDERDDLSRMGYWDDRLLLRRLDGHERRK